MRILVVGPIVLLLLVASANAQAEPAPPAGAEVKVGDMPVLSFTPVNGDKPVSLADYRGKVVLVEFFATWCPLCMEHFRNVPDLAERHGDAVQVVLVSLDKDKGRLEKFIAGKRITWPVYFDGKGWDNDVYTRWYAGRGEGIPRSYVIGGDGRVTFATFTHDGLEAAVADAVDKATASAAAR